MIIAIDGPAGSGKSTVARRVAKKLGFVYFDTGAMYRCFTWYVLENKKEESEQEILDLLPSFIFEVQTDHHEEKRYLVNNQDVSLEIRSERITNQVSKIASIKKVREHLVKLQQAFAKEHHAVFEGRDMGTVVFPQAELKIFLVASPEERAKRRYKEFLEKFPEKKEEINQQKILEEIKRRDQMDSQREVSPLRQAEDAILIDTTSMSIEQVVHRILKLVKRRQKKKPMGFLYFLVYCITWLIMKVFYRFTVYGREHYLSGPAIIAANHASYFDPAAITLACPEEIHFLGRETLFKNTFFKKLISALNTHPISGKVGDRKIFRLLKDLVHQRRKILIFPEGTRTRDGKMQKLQPGIGLISYITHAKILPVYIDGGYEVWNRHHKFPRPFGKITVTFGEYIDPKLYYSMDKNEAIAKIVSDLESGLAVLEKSTKSK